MKSYQNGANLVAGVTGRVRPGLEIPQTGVSHPARDAAGSTPNRALASPQAVFD